MCGKNVETIISPHEVLHEEVDVYLRFEFRGENDFLLEF